MDTKEQVPVHMGGFGDVQKGNLLAESGADEEECRR